MRMRTNYQFSNVCSLFETGKGSDGALTCRKWLRKVGVREVDCCADEPSGLCSHCHSAGYQRGELPRQKCAALLWSFHDCECGETHSQWQPATCVGLMKHVPPMWMLFAASLRLPISSLIPDSQELAVFRRHFTAVSFAKYDLHGFHNGRGQRIIGLFQSAARLGKGKGFFNVHRVGRSCAIAATSSMRSVGRRLVRILTN
jgi:hypothetical protein